MALVHVDAARAAAPLVNEDDYVVARVDELSQLNRQALPRVCPAGGVLEDRLMAVGDLPVWEVRSVPLDIGVEPGQCLVEVTPQEGVPHRPNDLNVLLRHRPPSIHRAVVAV